MTFLQFYTALRRRIGNPSTTSVTDASLKGYVNQGYHHITNRYRFRHYTETRREFDTVAGTASYALAATELAVRKVWNKTRNRQLKPVAYNRLWEMDRTISEPTFMAEPVWYYREGNNILLFPTPGLVQTLEVIAKSRLADMSADGDVPAIPFVWDTGILLMAEWYYYDDTTKDSPKKKELLDDFALWVSTLPSEVSEEMEDWNAGTEIPHFAAPTRRSRRSPLWID